jgi:hypothetical protein
MKATGGSTAAGHIPPKAFECTENFKGIGLSTTKNYGCKPLFVLRANLVNDPLCAKKHVKPVLTGSRVASRCCVTSKPAWVIRVVRSEPRPLHVALDLGRCQIRLEDMFAAEPSDERRPPILAKPNCLNRANTASFAGSFMTANTFLVRDRQSGAVVSSLVSVAKVKIVLWNRPFWHFSAASFACQFGVVYDTHVG